MSNQQTALRLALEALENHEGNYKLDAAGCDRHDNAINAIKQARALDKMAENARELGLDYEPAPVQPVAQAWDEGYRAGIDDERTSEANIGITGMGMKVEPARNNPYHTTPPAQPAPVQEPLEYWNAVEGWVKIDEVREHFNSVGCGTIYKTAGEGRVPLTAAQPAPVQPVAWGVFEGGNLHDMFFTKEEADNMAHLKGLHAEIRPLTTPPAAQPAPPECQTEAEKTAFAFGWWKALESVRQPAVPDAIVEAGESPDYRDGWNDCRQAMLKARGA